MKIYFFVIFLLFIGCNSSGQNNDGSNKTLSNDIIQKKVQIDSLKIYFQKAKENNSKENEIKFINSFPNSFLQFQETFGYDDSQEKGMPLYKESYDYIQLFFKSINKNPSYNKKVFNLAINGYWNADAENFLQMNLEKYFSENPLLVCKILNEYTIEQQQSIWNFISDGIESKKEIPKYLDDIKKCNDKIYTLAVKSFKSSKSDKESSTFQTYVLDATKMKTNGKEFRISILEDNKNKNAEKHTGLPVAIEVKNGNEYDKINENNNLIFKNDENCVIGEYSKTSVKNNYFTIEQVYCKGFLYVQSYTTFKIIDNDNIFLHKYGEEYTDRSNPDKDIQSITKSEKDFGKVRFENVTEEFLMKLVK